MAKHFTDFDLSSQAETTEEREPPVSAAERMAKQKDDIANQVANAAEEIERLRMRQEELEYAKKALHELNRKQDRYDHGKKEIIANLDRSVLQMEKDEVRAGRMVELLSTTRAQFKETLTELRGIHEEGWGENDFEEELDRALVVTENARMLYNKSIAKIDAESWQRGERPASTLMSRDGVDGASIAEKGFLFWLKVGVALSLPMFLALLGIAALFFWISGK